MGLFGNKALTARRDDVRRAIGDLSVEQQKHLDQQVVDRLERDLAPREVVGHIAIDWLGQKSPKVIGITNQRVIRFNESGIFRSWPLSSIRELNGGRMRDSEFKKAPYFVRMEVESDTHWYFAQTEAEIARFRQKLKQEVASA